MRKGHAIRSSKEIAIVAASTQEMNGTVVFRLNCEGSSLLLAVAARRNPPLVHAGT